MKGRRAFRVVGHAWVTKKDVTTRYLVRSSAGVKPEHNYLEVERLTSIDENGPICLHCLSSNVEQFKGESNAWIVCKDCHTKSYYL